ncbi:MAG: 23S rRNA (pseudouridine(1915)-N(3))-methyltransferase RlmH [Paludibacteraceae bacterium]|nr:23S rRNA (pseudouridine(1915)-N(3))-methyltransferase RlmH [Paludibacteraceae bacterium]
MKITLLVVGKTTDQHLQTLISDYVARLGHYVPFQVQVIPELKNVKALSQEQQKNLEGELILKAVGPATELILLDEHGTEFRSIAFADYIAKKMAARRDVCLVIGGPFGFSNSVYQRAEGKISLSQMTFSHQMIRLLLVEQLYRAFTIIRGEKYHHE